jgi:hypothetical protein
VANEAHLTLPQTEGDLVNLLPGCRIVPQRPGEIHVRARLDDLVSNEHVLRIEPVAAELDRLEITCENRKPMAIGETRRYHVWGYPRGGGPRQNLTQQVSVDGSDPAALRLVIETVLPDPATTVLQHRAGELVGLSAGRARVRAAWGERLASNMLEFVVAEKGVPVDLRIEVGESNRHPARLVLRVGDRSPPFRVKVRLPDETVYREIDAARLEVLDPQVLGPAPDAPRSFVALRPGETQVRAVYGELEDFATVRVMPDLFSSFTPEWELDAGGRRMFRLHLTIRADATGEPVQYRIAHAQGHPEWVPARKQGNEMQVQLTTPFMTMEAAHHIYHVDIEARVGQDGPIEKYPYTFKIVPSRVR